MRTAVATVVFVLAALWIALPELNFRRDCAGVDTTPLRKTKVVLTNGKAKAEIDTEVALSKDEKRQGLMCRKTLADANTMLFPYQKPVSDGFWMFKTYIDLDILYIAQNGAVIETVRMKKCPRRLFEKTPQWQNRCILQAREYRPDRPYTAALEVPAGYLERSGLPSGKAIRAVWKRGNF